ncbi:MAG TPA: UvrB/UvrC motif-containing protein [Candidatus Hungatella pullicola]|nr:UvrB/UvrC motif-containing protein [Candidatus Hungatella pullicola]
MLCERCKIREANIQYTEVINGVKKEHHFCAQCAREMDFGPYSAIFDGDMPLGKLLSGLLGLEDTRHEPDKLHQISCPVCKTTYDEFVKESRFGCADCYSVFGPLMEDSIKQLQGSVVHTGKRPSDGGGESDHMGEEETKSFEQEGFGARSDAEKEIQEWEAKRRDALRMEDYETAAVCRDRIRELKKGTESDA